MAAPRISSTREQFINNISVGNIVAFRSNSGMYSAKVIEVRETNKPLVVQTKNGSILYIDRQDVTWVKNGTHWPAGIYNALKYTKRASERTEPSTQYYPLPISLCPFQNPFPKINFTKELLLWQKYLLTK